MLKNALLILSINQQYFIYIYIIQKSTFWKMKLKTAVNCSGKCCDGFMWNQRSNICVGMYSFNRSIFQNVKHPWNYVSYFLIYKKQRGFFSACPDGFIGKECNTLCPYPTYGRNCDFICDCRKESCNAAIGCLQGKQCFWSPVIINVTFCTWPLFAVVR